MGIETSYTDGAGRRRVASDAALAAVAEVLSEPDERDAVVVVRAGESAPAPGVGAVETEDGGSAPVDGDLPPDLPTGYHELVHADGRRTRLVVAPRRCHVPAGLRAWGWAVQLYAARSRASWGVGDLGDARSLARWARAGGAEVVVLNPLHAAAADQPSPYFPTSRCFRNPLYVCVDDVPGARDDDAVAALAARARALPRDRIARVEAHRLKLAALERLWERWRGSASFDRYRAGQGRALEDFATFATISELHAGGPRSWPAELAHARASGVERVRRAHAGRVAFHAWVQWLLDEQVRRLGRDVGVVHDVAIGVDPDGADRWAEPDVFADGVTVGAPPDAFNAGGQDWGVPPYDPWKLRAAGYEPFVRTLRAAFAGAAGVRIDHVMGLFRLFWVPAGLGPRDGVYVRYPHRELLAVVALESERAGAYVVGEDLGTVEPLVREEMAAHSMLSYRLLWFERNEPRAYPKLALAAVTNHDLPTIAGVWTGADVREQRALGLEPDEDVARALRDRLRDAAGVADDAPVEDVVEGAYRALGAARSALAIATLEDALAVERRPNQPGTTDERPNWSLPLPVPVDDLDRHSLPARVARALTEARG
ncbi:MAG TPA: 4-alpha-glucanotransferase [Actinomycetota bacterium]|nr:4-alpha-glucanotransferase [Actinomycetota bacterium]